MAKKDDNSIRNFQEIVLKPLLEQPTNVHDLLRLTGSDLVERIDFDELTGLSTTLISDAYRNVESDVLLIAPFRVGERKGGTRRVLLYVLIKHQS